MKSRIETDFESLYKAKPLGGLSADELRGSNRRYPLPIYRGMIAEQLRNRGYSLPAIGKLFGRSHATILHELRLLKNLDTPCYRTIREEYEDFKRCCENIKCETNMKAIVNGVVYNVEELLLDNGESYYAGGIEIIPDGRHIDWEQRRFELVLAAMQGYISNDGREYLHKESSMKNTAELCVAFADAVIAEYRKGGKK